MHLQVNTFPSFVEKKSVYDQTSNYHYMPLLLAYSTLAKNVGALLDETCTNDPGSELDLLLGASSRANAKDKVDNLCQTGYKEFKNDNTKKP